VISLTDDQLAAILIAAAALPPEKRTLFIERVAAHLKLRGRGNIEAAITAALQGLVHGSAA
jgi:hypothetical protein